MGSLCANCAKDEGTETDYHSKNAEELVVTLGQCCQVRLINGNYRLHRGQTLLVISELKYIQNCLPLRQYASNGDKIIDALANTRKGVYKNLSTKNSPYQQLFLCALQSYKSENSADYQEQFRSIIASLLETTSEVVLELTNTVESMSGLPNQMLLSILLGELVKCEQAVKLHLVTNQRKMLSMYKYELMKTEACTMGAK